jgi:putative membrane protein
MILMVVFWLAIVGLAIWLLSSLFPTEKSAARHRRETGYGASSGTEMDVLNERYARGEISRAEYEELRRGLNNVAPGP